MNQLLDTLKQAREYLKYSMPAYGKQAAECNVQITNLTAAIAKVGADKTAPQPPDESDDPLEKFFELDDAAYKAGLIGNRDTDLRAAAQAVVDWYDANDAPWIPEIDRLRKALEK